MATVKNIKKTTSAKMKKKIKDSSREIVAAALEVGIKAGIPDNEYRTIKDRNIAALWNTILGSEGFGKGLIYEFFGESEVGKTGTLMMLCGEFQRQGETYGHVDAEHAMNKKFAKKKLKVDVDKVLISEEAIRSGEHGFEVALKMIESGAGVLVIDSIAALRPEESMTGERDRIGAHALLMSKQMPRLAEAAAKGKTTVFTVNQTRKNIGQLFGDNTTTTGGNSPGFYASIRVRVSKIKVVKGPNGEELGYIVKYRPTKNRTGYKRGEFSVVMGRGFIPNLTDTAVLWAKNFPDLGLIDRDLRTICNLPIKGAMNSDKSLANAIRGSEFLVFEAVDDFFTNQELDNDTVISELDETDDVNSSSTPASGSGASSESGAESESGPLS